MSDLLRWLCAVVGFVLLLIACWHMVYATQSSTWVEVPNTDVRVLGPRAEIEPYNGPAIYVDITWKDMSWLRFIEDITLLACSVAVFWVSNRLGLPRAS